MTAGLYDLELDDGRRSMVAGPRAVAAREAFVAKIVGFEREPVMMRPIMSVHLL